MKKISVSCNDWFEVEIPIEIKVNDFYKYDGKKRIRFIKYCLSKRMSYEDIGKILGVSKQRIYQLSHYGKNLISQLDRKRILERDGFKCCICGKNKSDKIKLHVHHKKDPRKTDHKELITVCPSCHKKIEKIKQENHFKKLARERELQKSIEKIRKQIIKEKSKI